MFFMELLIIILYKQLPKKFVYFSDLDDKGIGFKGKGFLSYKSHKKATPFLVLYILFKPLNDDGVLLHRFRKCDDTKCAHEVLLTLEEGKPVLQASDGKFGLEIEYPNKLKVLESSFLLPVHHFADFDNMYHLNYKYTL